MTPTRTPAELGKLMLGLFQRDDYLDHAEAADLIADAGGDDYLFTNDNGNIAIDTEVLKEFRKLTEKTAIWMKSTRAWRLRDPLTDTEDSREQPL